MHFFLHNLRLSVFLLFISLLLILLFLFSSITVLISRCFSSSLNVPLFILSYSSFINSISSYHFGNTRFFPLIFYAACIFLFPMNFSLPYSSQFILVSVFHARGFPYILVILNGSIHV